MSPSEWASLIGYIKTFIDIQNKPEVQTMSVSDENTDSLHYLFENYTVEEIADMARTKATSEVTAFATVEPQLDLAMSTLFDTLEGFLECAGYMKDAERGFDLYVSEDGVNFETITINGFGDPFNHGLRTFSSLDDGLMIGTANPFYACQVWMLEDGAEAEEEPTGFFAVMEKIFGGIYDYFKTFFDDIFEMFF